MMTQILKKLLLSLLSFVVLILLMELAIRLFLPVADSQRWAVPHERYGFYHRRNFEQTVWYPHTNVTWTVQTDSLGLRGPELDFDNTTALRILLLGDSFTFGYGLNREETFAGRLEVLFAEADQEVMVINTGTAGWGTSQALLFARDHLDLFRPDVVVITVCENDPVDDLIFADGLAGGILPSFPGKRFLRDRFHLYGLVYNAVYERLYAARMSQPVNATRKHSEQERAPQEFSAAPAGYWDSTITQIRSFRQQLSAERPGSLLLVQLSEFWKPGLTETLKGLDDGADLLFVDLNHQVGAVPVEALYLDYDPHWNARMHDYSALSLFKHITANLLDRQAVP